MTNSIDKILGEISAKIKDNMNGVTPDFFDKEKVDESPLMFLTQDMIISDNKTSGQLSLEKQAKIITYDIYEKLDVEVDLHKIYEIILQSLRNINS
ncbi:MAG: hypothetical protein LBR35_00230 [Rickettsiales bacterium]|jgi:hypothetical protein|nr:hypothetical protein [Rickettsiales bacterium]